MDKIYNNNLTLNKNINNTINIKINKHMLYVHNVVVNLYQIINNINKIYNNKCNNIKQHINRKNY